MTTQYLFKRTLFKRGNLLPLLSVVFALLLGALLLLLTQTGASSAAGMVATPERAVSVEAAPSSPCFTEVNVPFGGVSYSSVAWADYDNDGDPDLVILGERSEMDEFNEFTTYHETKLYRNNNGTFVDIGINLVGASSGTVTWGDYDGDSYLDLLITGQNNESDSIMQLYHNVENVEGGRTFTKVSTPFEDEYRWGSAAWADYDNDGDPDLVVSGYASSFVAETVLYRNDNGVFVKQEGDGYTFKGVREGKMAWGDYDGDSVMDLFIAGRGTEYQDLVAMLYRNDNGKFIEQTGDGYTFPKYQNASVTWADYDKDNDLDLMIAGATSGGDVFTKLYRNDNSSFIDSEANLAGFFSGDMAWGDYDKDGDLDLMIAGSEDGFDHIAKLYRNDGGNLTEQTDVSTPAFPVTWNGSIAWADYDGDGDLDLLITGFDNSSNQVAKLYRNGPCGGGSNVFDVPDGDVQALINAIHAANAASTQGTARQSSSAVVNLAANGHYTLTAAENMAAGGNGLPVITGTVTINGNGATIARSSAEGTAAFRILNVTGMLRLDSVTLRNGSITGEGYSSGSGGAILNSGILTLTHSTITGNRADRDGGGIANLAFDQNAYLEIDSSRVLSNTAGRNGGGISSHANDQQTAILLVRQSEIAGNQVPSESFVLFAGYGGGIYASDVDDEFGSGGKGATGFVTVTHSSVHHNKATDGGGGLANRMDGASRIEMAVISSAIYSNSARADGNGVGNGGGLFNIDAVLMLQNSTVSGNEAAGFGIVGSGYGGGVYTASKFRNATFTSLNSTIAHNQATNGGGGVAYADSDEPATATTALQNSIVSHNIEGLISIINCGSADFVPGENGIVSQGNNLEDKDSCGFTQAGDLSNTDPMLGPLADNGGPTWTHALLDNSPAIDAANSATCPATDQRGVARPVGDGCDIGAYEGGTRTALFTIFLPLAVR